MTFLMEPLFRGYENTSLMAVSPHSILIRVGAIDMLVTNRKSIFVVVVSNSALVVGVEAFDEMSKTSLNPMVQY